MVCPGVAREFRGVQIPESLATPGAHLCARGIGNTTSVFMIGAGAAYTYSSGRSRTFRKGEGVS